MPVSLSYRLGAESWPLRDCGEAELPGDGKSPSFVPAAPHGARHGAPAGALSMLLWQRQDAAQARLPALPGSLRLWTPSPSPEPAVGIRVMAWARRGGPGRRRAMMPATCGGETRR